MPAWYDRAFGPWYLELYAHRDEAEAEAAVETALRWLPGPGLLLDAACGGGRHLAALARHGRSGVGADRSPHLLGAAHARLGDEGRLVRADMRQLPFAPGSFGGVLSMFTSFGYFGTREAHCGLLAEFGRVAAPRGRLLLDYVNAPLVRAGLAPSSRREIRDHVVEETRSLRRQAGDEAVVKEVTIRDASGRVVERYREEVSLYDPEEVASLLRVAGWREVVRLGAYDGSLWNPEAPRLLIVAERAQGPA